MSKLNFFWLFALLSSLILNPIEVSAHGYVVSPASRNYRGSLDKTVLGYSAAFAKYGAVINEPQSLEYLKGFPAQGPTDGHIASANGILGDYILDQQGSNRWNKTNITTGVNSFTWKYTAYHNTAKWHYYMTKPGWNPNQPITRADLELIGTINHNGTPPSDNSPHQITVPSNRQGYHVIVAIWDIADTLNAFYNVIDVNVTSSVSGGTVSPTIPTGLNSENITSISAKISWLPQNDATSFIVYRNDTVLQEVSTSSYQDSGLVPNTSYTYRVQAKGSNGLTSLKSESIIVKTQSAVIQELPTTPTHLHSMGTTATSASLMWGASSHSHGIKHYQIFRNNSKIAEVIQTTYQDTGLVPDTQYQYFVKAVSQNNDISDAGNILSIKTKTSNAAIQAYCGANTYNAQNSYPAINTHVFYNCRIWKNKWYANPNELPGTNMVWEEVGICSEAPDCANSQPVLICGSKLYDPMLAYPNAGTKVYFNNKIWESKWYANPGETPGTDLVWKPLGDCNEVTMAKHNMKNVEEPFKIFLTEDQIRFFPERFSEQISEIMIYDYRGISVKPAQTLRSNKIDISNLPDGIYILKITTIDGIVRTKTFRK